MTIKRADAKATQITVLRRGRRRARLKKADADATQIKCPQREAKGDNKESVC